jgi:hypothetical protein
MDGLADDVDADLAAAQDESSDAHDIELPNFVYRSPGPHPAGGNRTFDYFHVTTEAQLDQRLKAGWHASKEQALAAEDAEKAAKAAK